MKLDCLMYNKQTNKMWSSKSLVMLKCGNRNSLHAVQHKWQLGSILMFCPYYFRNRWPRDFVCEYLM